MSLPDWADKKLSEDLPILRARGENQDIEYMVQFPQSARELGKEIAAFATSNPGTILIGVSDDGGIEGLDNASSHTERDNLIKRIEGICRGVVKPALTPTARFTVEDGKIVLIVIVPKGNQPVYYCNDIPYIRHLSQSRPADPHEA
jgi:predicted HTH transcriptional regulator